MANLTVDEEVIVEQLNEILSSGPNYAFEYGSQTREVAEEAIRELFNGMTSEEIQETVEAYYQEIEPFEIRMGELEMMASIVGKPFRASINLTFIDE